MDMKEFIKTKKPKPIVIKYEGLEWSFEKYRRGAPSKPVSSSGFPGNQFVTEPLGKKYFTISKENENFDACLETLKDFYKKIIKFTFGYWIDDDFITTQGMIERFYCDDKKELVSILIIVDK